jgi:hypothetical protein
MTDKPLRLRAEDLEDLSIIASCLQDAILPVADMAYAPAERRFVMVANRFRWECAGTTGGDQDERVHCGVAFGHVTRSQVHQIDLHNRGLLLNLLTILAEPRETGFRVTLLCADDRAIGLDVSAIDILMGDYGDPWPTPARPCHDNERK